MGNLWRLTAKPFTQPLKRVAGKSRPLPRTPNLDKVLPASDYFIGIASQIGNRAGNAAFRIILFQEKGMRGTTGQPDIQIERISDEKRAMPDQRKNTR